MSSLSQGVYYKFSMLHLRKGFIIKRQSSCLRVSMHLSFTPFITYICYGIKPSTCAKSCYLLLYFMHIGTRNTNLVCSRCKLWIVQQEISRHLHSQTIIWNYLRCSLIKRMQINLFPSTSIGLSSVSVQVC